MAQLATFPTMAYQICLNQDPNDPAAPVAVWTDFSTRVRGDGPTTMDRGRQYERTQVETGTWTPTIRNEDGAFNPSGPNALPGLKIYRRMRALATLGQGNAISDNDSLFATPASSWTVTNGTIGPSLRTLGPIGLVGAVGLLTAAGAGTLLATSSAVYAVTALQVYSLLGYFEAVTVGRSCQVKVTWRTAGGGVLSSSTVGPVTSSTTAWAQVAALVTAPATAAQATVEMQVLGAAAGELHYIAQPALLPTSLNAPNLQPDWQPQLSPKAIFTGLTERYPQAWDLDGTYGVCRPPIVEILAGLAQTPLNRVVTSEILLDAPLAYYPLQESDGAASAGDYSSGNRGLRILSSKYGAGAVNFGTTSTLIDGDTAVMFQPPGSPSTTQAASILSAGQPLIPAYGPFSIAFWANFGSTVPTVSGTFIAGIFYNGNGSKTQYIAGSIFDTTTGAFAGKFVVSASSQGFAVEARSSANLCDGKWHHVGITFPGDGVATTSLWIDGVLNVTATAGSPITYESAIDTQIGGNVITDGSSPSGTQMPFQMSHFAVFSGVLSNARIASQYAAGKTGFAGETSGARINRLLSYGPYYGPKAIDTGTSTMAPAIGLQDQKLLPALQDVATTEDGVLFAAADGTLRLQGRQARYAALSPKWSFGPTVAVGEIPYLGDIAYDYDPTLVANQAEFGRPNGATVRLQDNASVLQYFPRGLSRTMLVDSDDQVYDAVAVAVQRYAQPQLRVQKMRFRPAAHPRAWYCALNLELGDRVTLNRKPEDGSPQILGDFFIEKIEHSPSAGDWYVDVWMSPVSAFSYFVLGAMRTTTSGAAGPGTTNLVLAPLPDSATNPIEADLVPGQLLHLEPGSAVDETVGIVSLTSASPGLAGYASFTVGARALLSSSRTLATALALSADPAGATVVLSGASNASTAFLVIDGEVFAVTAGSGTATLTVTRAQNSSQAPHAAGRTVYELASTGTVFAHASGMMVSEVLLGAAIDPAYYDPVSQLGNLSTTLSASAGIGSSSLTLRPTFDYPANNLGSDLGFQQLLTIEPGTGSSEPVQVMGVSSLQSDGTATVSLGSLLTAAASAGATSCTVTGFAANWSVGQKVGITSGASFATIASVTGNTNGTVTLGLNTGSFAANTDVGASIWQFTKTAHTSGKTVVAGTDAVTGTARLAA